MKLAKSTNNHIHTKQPTRESEREDRNGEIGFFGEHN